MEDICVAAVVVSGGDATVVERRLRTDTTRRTFQPEIKSVAGKTLTYHILDEMFFFFQEMEKWNRFIFTTFCQRRLGGGLVIVLMVPYLKSVDVLARHDFNPLLTTEEDVAGEGGGERESLVQVVRRAIRSLLSGHVAFAGLVVGSVGFICTMNGHPVNLSLLILSLPLFLSSSFSLPLFPPSPSLIQRQTWTAST
jgi:hypothetical protein